MKHILTSLLGLLILVLPAAQPHAGERNRPFLDRPSVGEPLRFRDANGGAFQPRALVISSPREGVHAVLPAAVNDARSEDRVDLSSTPLVGPLFQGTLGTHDAREGQMVGTLHQGPGGILVLSTELSPRDLTGRPVTLTTNLPRDGAVSYPVGRLTYQTGRHAGPPGPRIGTAHLVGDRLVLASEGGEAAYPSVEALVRDIFQ